MASVREAVKRLEQLRLVEVRHGDAMRVRDWRAARRARRDRAPAVPRRRASTATTLAALLEARAADARRGGAAGRRAPQPTSRPSGSSELAERIADAPRRRGGPGARLRVHDRAGRGRRQRRLRADPELDPRSSTSSAPSCSPRVVAGRDELAPLYAARPRAVRGRAPRPGRRRGGEAGRARRSGACSRRSHDADRAQRRARPRSSPASCDTVVAPEPRAAAGARDRRRGVLRPLAGALAAAQPRSALRGAALRGRARARARSGFGGRLRPLGRGRARAAARARSSAAPRRRVRAAREAAQGHRAASPTTATTRVMRAARLRRRRERAPRRASCARGRAGRERARRPPATPTRDGTRHVRAERASAWSDGAPIAGERVVRADVCVIGTGAGGAPVAKELAEGGMQRGDARGGRALHRPTTSPPARAR